MSRENEIRSVTCPHCLIWRGSPVAFGGHVQWDCPVINAKRAGARPAAPALRTHRASELINLDGRLPFEIGGVDGHRET